MNVTVLQMENRTLLKEVGKKELIQNNSVLMGYCKAKEKTSSTQMLQYGSRMFLTGVGNSETTSRAC